MRERERERERERAPHEMRGREREKEIKQKEKERVSWGQRASDDRKKAFSEIGRVTKCQTKLEKGLYYFAVCRREIVSSNGG